MFGKGKFIQNVRVVNDMSKASIYGRKFSLISILLLLASLFALGVFIAGVVMGTDAPNWIQAIDSANIGLVKSCWFLIIFIATPCLLLALGGMFIGNRLVNLDIPFSPKKNERMQKKLKKYEYSYAKYLERKQKRKSNKALKKNYLKQYKENKK